MKELQSSTMQDTSGGYFGVFLVLSMTYLFYRQMQSRGHFQMKDFGRWH